MCPTAPVLRPDSSSDHRVYTGRFAGPRLRPDPAEIETLSVRTSGRSSWLKLTHYPEGGLLLTSCGPKAACGGAEQGEGCRTLRKRSTSVRGCPRRPTVWFHPGYHATRFRGTRLPRALDRYSCSQRECPHECLMSAVGPAQVRQPRPGRAWLLLVAVQFHRLSPS